MTAQQSSTAPVGPRPDGEDQFPAGAQVFVRDEVWLVRNSVRTEHDGAKVDVVGVSDFVRDQGESARRKPTGQRGGVVA